MRNFLNIIASKDPNNVAKLSKLCPGSLKTVHNMLGLKGDDFIQYVVCYKCNSVYDLAACTEKSPAGQVIIKHCIHVEFPNHPMHSKRQPCGTPLLQKISRVRVGNTQLQPFKIYPYYPIKVALSRLFNRSGFLSMCEHWRKRQTNLEYLGDIYDGNMWKDYQTFLAVPHSLVTCLNLDWFQPFTHVTYSVGALYMVILNLPREERYKIENIILLSIIPGPKEPKLNVNSFLSPLVEELHDLWDGIPIQVSSSHKSILVRLAVICIACDVPAVRKMCGFAGHSASMGCSKCKCTFVHHDWGMDHSDFNRTEWEARNSAEHRQYADQYVSAMTASQQAQCLKDNGVRYSVLLELPYIDLVRCHIIDPMHNLLLGSAKHVMKTWLARSIITSKDLEIIEYRVSKILSPHDVGRLPLKISSSFSGFTADQWMNWTMVYSAVALKGILPSDHYRCWLLFVRACSILCSKLIKISDVHTADQYLLLFCQNFQLLFGAEACTPNMHLHLHLKESILDYGPVYAFWLFSYERFNRVLGAYSTNNINIEVQLMRKFVNEQKAKHLPFPKEYAELSEILFKCDQTTGSVHHTSCPTFVFELKEMCTAPIHEIKSFKINEAIKLFHPVSQRVLSIEQIKSLKLLYTQLYPGKQIEHISHFYMYSSKALLNLDLVGSTQSRNKRASVIVAYWPNKGSSLATIDNTKLQAGTVQYFMEHKIIIKDDDGTTTELPHILCFINWFVSHPQHSWYGQSAVVTHTLEEVPSPMQYMPIQRIVS